MKTIPDEINNAFGLPMFGHSPLYLLEGSAAALPSWPFGILLSVIIGKLLWLITFHASVATATHSVALEFGQYVIMR